MQVLATQPTSIDSLRKRLEELTKEFDKISDGLTGVEREFSNSSLAHMARRAHAAVTFVRDSSGKGNERKDLEPIKIDQKSLKRVKESFGILQSIHQQLEALQQIDAQLGYNFRGDKKASALLSQTSELRKAYEKKSADAVAVLNKIGSQQEPKEFKKIVEKTMETTREGLDGRFTKASQYVYVNQVTEERVNYLEFTHYVDFKNLVSDAQSFVYPDYYVVFTCRVAMDGRSPRYWVNTQHKFKIPGTFRRGTEFKDTNSASRALAALLEVDSFVDALDRRPIHVGTDDLRKENLGSKTITDVKVDNDKVVFVLQKDLDEAAVKKEVNAILGALRAALNITNHSHLRYSRPELGSQGWRFAVVIVRGSTTKSIRLQPSDLNMLKNRFGFDDDDLRNLTRMLDKGAV